jgi:hypothetical protein
MTHTTDRYGNSYIGAGAGFGYPAVGLTAGYVMQPGDTVFSNTYIPSAAEMRDFLTGLSAWFGAVGGIAVNGPNDVNRNRTAITLTTPSFGANYAWESSFEVLSSCPSQGS